MSWDLVIIAALAYLWAMQSEDEPKPKKPDYAAMRTPSRMPF